MMLFYHYGVIISIYWSKGSLFPPKLKVRVPFTLRHFLRLKKLVLPAGLEPAAYSLEGNRSVQLSYGSLAWALFYLIFVSVANFDREE